MALRVVQNMQGAVKFLQNVEGKDPLMMVLKRCRSVTNPAEC